MLSRWQRVALPLVVLSVLAAGGAGGGAVVVEDAQAAPSVATYTVTDLGAFQGRSESSAVNGAGVVVGSSDASGGALVPVVYQGGTMSALPNLSAYADGAALAINQGGVVVGWSRLSSSLIRAVEWVDGSATALPDFGYGVNQANDINSAGEVVGSVQKPASGSVEYPAVWSNGALSLLPALPHGDAYSLGVNDSGEVVGSSGISRHPYHAVSWNGGVIHDLSGADVDAYAEAVSATGQVVGEAAPCCGFGYPTGPYQAMLWSDEVARSLTASSSDEHALSINDAWQVVGGQATGGDAFIFENGTLYNLNSLLTDANGWSVFMATGISSDGTIAAIGYKPATDPNGFASHALLLTPSAPLAADTTPPSGTLALDGGAIATSSATIPVDAPGSDASGIFEVRLANSGTVDGNGELMQGKSFAPDQPITWNLTATVNGGTLVDGQKIVYAQWRDWRGNWSSPINATITLSRPVFVISASLAPNSFPRGSHTVFSFQTNRSATDTVQLRNSAGTIIRRWKLGVLDSSVHRVKWSGKRANGTWAPLGTYDMRLVATNGITVTSRWRKVTVTTA